MRIKEHLVNPCEPAPGKPFINGLVPWCKLV